VSSTTCLAGIDFGTKRIGVALSDAGRTVAVPLALYQRHNRAQDADYFRQLAVEHRIGGWVVGLPLHLSGDEMKITQVVRDFGHWLAEVTQLPVVFWDERLTSAQAERLLAEAGIKAKQRQEKLDKLAAQILLQSYLDAGCPPADDSL
jgi:putative Holliday junction resolvase